MSGSRWTSWIGSLAAMAAIGVAAPGAAAQAQLAPRVSEATTRADGATPESLSREAFRLHENPDRWAESARLHEESAELRGDGDPLAFDGYRWSGILYYHAGELGKSRKELERAADLALSYGDVESAATAYVLGAFVAQDAGDVSGTNRLGRKAERLASSPLLSPAQRDAIRDRIHRPEAQMALGD